MMIKKDIKALILDMDGVLWRAYHPIVDLKKVFLKIKEMGLKYAFATNNSTKHISTYLDKLNNFGIPVTEGQIITSSIATAQKLRNEFPEGGSVFIVGEKEMARTFSDFGFSEAEENALAVVVGLDLQLEYEKMAKAATLIRNGAKFIGTNPDLTFPIPGSFAPGAGSFLAFIEAASGVKPEIVGKPQPEMFKQALTQLDSQSGETLVIGDRLETDILGGQTAGCLTGLVLSGVSDRESGENWTPKVDIIAENLDDMIDMISND